jgi:hypothetical protein
MSVLEANHLTHDGLQPLRGIREPNREVVEDGRDPIVELSNLVAPAHRYGHQRTHVGLLHPIPQGEEQRAVATAQ